MTDASPVYKKGLEQEVIKLPIGYRALSLELRWMPMTAVALPSRSPTEYMG